MTRGLALAFVCLSMPILTLAQGLDKDKQENRKFQQRRISRLEEVKDETGRVRPDLWKKGVEHYKKMNFAAGVRRASRSKAKAALKVDNQPMADGGVQGVQWKQLGPQPAFPIAQINFQGNGPMSGEVTDIAIDPRGSSDQVIYISSNDGGVWKSTDGGVTFFPKTDYMPSLSMGAVALDPASPWIVYAGTGNLFDGSPQNTTLTVKAVGLYRSVDMGESWAVLNPGGIFTGNGINRILVLPDNGLLVASANGLFRSANGGVSFGSNAPLFDNGSPLLNGFISDLDLDVANGNTIYASVSGTGLFRSTNGGSTFPTNLIAAGSGGPTGYARFWFAQAESNPLRMYINVQDSGGGFDGLFRSDDGGTTWADPGGAAARAAENNGCQCGYDQTVAVDPLNPDRVFIGFQELYVSTDAGANFATPAISRNKIHWDHHATLWSPPSHRGPAPVSVRFWVGTDGGLHSTADYGVNFNNNHNITIATNLFTDIDIGRGSAANNAVTAGGTQDTGTLHKNAGIAGNQWNMGINGDGGGVSVSPGNPLRLYGGGNNGYITSDDGGATWANPGVGANAPGSAWRYAIDLNNASNVFAITSTNNGFQPGNTLFRTTDNAANWANLGLLGGNARSVANTRSDPNLLWFGLTSGQAQRIANALAPAPTFEAPVNIPANPGGQINGIAINPLNSNDVVAVYLGLCGACNASNRQRRVFRTLDGGGTWADISGTDGNPIGNLPNLPMHSVVFDTGTIPVSILVSSDAGVLRTSNGGATWEKLGLGLPVVSSKRLQIDESQSPPVLRLGSYGRSVFQLVEADGPLIAVNADLGFDTGCVGERSTRVVQVFNVGSQNLIVNAFFRVSGSTAFRVLSGPATPATIPPGEHLDWTIEFGPTAAGAQSAVFQINSNDPFEPSKQLSASGTSNAQMISTFIANSGNFGEVCIGAFKDLNLTVANVGCGTLSITNITSNLGDFVLSAPSPYPLTVSGGNSIQIPVRFQPATLGAKNANITVATNDPLTPSKVVAVTGTVGAPNAEVSPSISFGEVCLGAASIQQQLTIRNSGTCNLIVTSVSFDPVCPDFTILETDFPRNVAPGSTTLVTVKFTPQSEGTKTCTLKVVTNDPDTPIITRSVTATLPGTILNVSPDASLGFLPEVVQSTGACSVSKPLTITNQGKCPARINSLTIGGPEAVDYKLLAAPALPLNLQSGQTLGEGNLKLQFAPFGLDRDRQGTVSVGYVSDAAAGTTASILRNTCGEGVRTGARILVRYQGGPYVSVEKLHLQRITANRNGKGTTVDSIETINNLGLVNVSPASPCSPFGYHREYGTVSNPVQLLTGDYLVTATILVGNRRLTKTVSFSVTTCDFNPQVIVDF